MSRDDFFGEIDKSISKTKAAEEGREKRIAQIREDFKEIIPRLIPTVQEYEKELIGRGIKVNVESSDSHITFKLRYKDGGHNDLYFGESKHFDGSFCFITYFTDDNGKRYESTNGTSYSEKNWNDQEYVEKLESHIKSFILYSERHGGF
ncbi:MULTISPECIES: hypothetical protein [unclassified Serratia (in: enterobacteria)]|uniref:hypothetical protein n=1 Tax=unclassified Serratia (in: enterobacteria) TaxID=2647522 RepID=UPI000468C745|nr:MULTISPECIES: hypothetical protein [unclassified Serratia (in: enterobacteria)]